MYSAKRYPLKLFVLELACSLIALSSYWLLWGSIDAFVGAIDEVPVLFYEYNTGMLALANLSLLAILYGIACSFFSEYATANAQKTAQKNSDCDDA